MTKSGETLEEEEEGRREEGKKVELTHSTVSRSRPGLLSVNSNSRAHRGCFEVKICKVEVRRKEKKGRVSRVRVAGKMMRRAECYCECLS